MALSRNQRRAIAKQRANDKLERIAKAAKAFNQAKVQAIVASPKRHKIGYFIDETGAMAGGYGYYPNHSSGSPDVMKGQSHRMHVGSNLKRSVSY